MGTRSRGLLAACVVAAAALLTAAAPLNRTDPTLLHTGFVVDEAPLPVVAHNAPRLATLSVAGIAVAADGTGVTAVTDGALRLLAAAHDHGLRAELLVSNYSSASGAFDPRAARRLLRDEDNLVAVADEVAGIAADGGWDGINVDLESLGEADGPGLVRFLHELQVRMPEEKTVSLDLQASTSEDGYRRHGYQLRDLAEIADTVALMTYDLHTPSWSGPGPIGPLPWQRAAVETLTSVVPRDKVDLGVAGYGYSWRAQRGGEESTVEATRRLVADDGATPVWDARAGEWRARLSDGTVVWWSDGRSFAARESLAKELGLHGLALWRIGSADPLS